MSPVTNSRKIGPIHSNSSTLVAYMYPRITWSIVNILCVTRFAKKALIYAQFQETLFHQHLLATSTHQQQMCLILLNLEQSAFTQAFFSSLSGIHECMLGWPLNCPIFSGLASRQPTVNHHTTG